MNQAISNYKRITFASNINKIRVKEANYFPTKYQGRFELDESNTNQEKVKPQVAARKTSSCLFLFSLQMFRGSWVITPPVVVCMPKKLYLIRILLLMSYMDHYDVHTLSRVALLYISWKVLSHRLDK
ncbi:hypothetical protein ACFE04_026057 [Oxalis oulophora]